MFQRLSCNSFSVFYVIAEWYKYEYGICNALFEERNMFCITAVTWEWESRNKSCLDFRKGHVHIGILRQGCIQKLSNKILVKHVYVETNAAVDGHNTGTCAQEYKTRQAMYVQRNFEAHSCNHSFRRKAIRITYSECVLAASRIQYAMQMHHIAICGLCDCTKVFPLCLINGTIFEKKKKKKHVLIFYSTFVSHNSPCK